MKRYLSKHDIGRIGENISVKYLVWVGYIIVHKNYKLPRWGELDIIAKKKNELLFVEVKTRTSSKFGIPSDSIRWHKRRNLMRSINYFLLKNKKYGDCRVRIVCFSIILRIESNKIVVTSIKIFPLFLR